jgi:flagellar M-ring protein FliF
MRHNIPYRYSEDGTQLLTPAVTVNRARMLLAQDGLPQQTSGPGNELMDQKDPLLTPEKERLNFIRAQQGELERSIMSLKPVARARVHLTVPEEKLFTEQQTPPSASIMLGLKPGQQLTSQQAQGIVHLVCYAVEGLQPERVGIVGEDGVPIWTGKNSGAPVEELLAREQQMEQDIENGVQQWFEGMFGPNKIRVQAQVELNPTTTEKTTEQYQPDPQQEEVLSRKTEFQELYAGPGTEAPEFPAIGTQPNLQLPTRTEGGGEAKGGRYGQRWTESEFKPSMEVTKETIPAGDIRRISVGVLIDEGLNISPMRLARLEEAAAAAAGIDMKRDALKIVTVPFQQPDKAGQAAVEKAAMYKQVARAGLNFVALLIGLFVLRSIILAFRPPLAALPPPFEDDEEADLLRRLETDLEARALPSSSEGPRVEIVPEPEPEPFEQPAPRERNVLDDILGDRVKFAGLGDNIPVLSGLRQMTEERPDDVAQVVRVWLGEDLMKE